MVGRRQAQAVNRSYASWVASGSESRTSCVGSGSCTGDPPTVTGSTPDSPRRCRRRRSRSPARPSRRSASRTRPARGGPRRGRGEHHRGLGETDEVESGQGERLGLGFVGPGDDLPAVVEEDLREGRRLAPCPGAPLERDDELPCVSRPVRGQRRPGRGEPPGGGRRRGRTPAVGRLEVRGDGEREVGEGSVHRDPCEDPGRVGLGPGCGDGAGDEEKAGEEGQGSQGGTHTQFRKATPRAPASRPKSG